MAEAAVLVEERKRWLEACGYTGWRPQIAEIWSTVAATQTRSGS